MSDLELQEEEREVILSIYEGDPAFNQISPVTYQYKYGEDGESRSFLLELFWNDDYPSKGPVVNMDTFYNKHLDSNVKKKIILHIQSEAEQLLGTAMTFTLFESVKEHFNDLMLDQPEVLIEEKENELKDECSGGVGDNLLCKKEKKEQLSKSQKRKQWDRVDCKGERARGWNWVDIVQHLSQTGTRPATS